MERDKQHFFLFADRDWQFSLFLDHFSLDSLQISSGVVLLLLELFSFLFEFSKSYSVALDFVLNNFYSSVAKFVLKEELMELSEVGVRVKDIE